MSMRRGNVLKCSQTSVDIEQEQVIYKASSLLAFVSEALMLPHLNITNFYFVGGTLTLVKTTLVEI
jgi:hypothetical protein